MKPNQVLLGIAFIFAVFSLLNTQWEMLPNSVLRPVISGIFFLPAVSIIGFKKLRALAIFGLLIICDLLLLEWEPRVSKYAYYLLHSLVISFLIFFTIKDMDWQKISSFEIISSVFFLLVNSYIFLILREYFSVEGTLLKILFNVNGFLLVLLVVLAYFYSTNHSSTISSYFFLGVLSMVVSDLMVFADYFLNFQTFIHLDNFFYVFGFFFLLKAFLENKLLNEANKAMEKNEKEEKVQETESSYR